MPIKDVLDMIPDILQYFVSGFIFIFLYKTLCSKKIDGFIQLIWSCVISFVWVSLIKAVNEIWLQNRLLENLWVIVFVSISLSVITSIVYAKIFVSKWFHNLLVTLFGISPHDSVWRNVAGNEKANIKVWFKGKDYYWFGHLFSYEDNGNESWFCLHKPVRYDINSQMIYSQKSNEGAFLVFNSKDVESVEIFTDYKNET